MYCRTPFGKIALGYSRDSAERGPAIHLPPNGGWGTTCGYFLFFGIKNREPQITSTHLPGTLPRIRLSYRTSQWSIIFSLIF